jgi:hypothetical protein
MHLCPLHISTALTEQIYVKFDTGDLCEMLLRIPSLLKIKRKYPPLYMKSQAGFVVADAIKSP